MGFDVTKSMYQYTVDVAGTVKEGKGVGGEEKRVCPSARKKRIKMGRRENGEKSVGRSVGGKSEERGGEKKKCFALPPFLSRRRDGPGRGYKAATAARRERGAREGRHRNGPAGSSVDAVSFEFLFLIITVTISLYLYSSLVPVPDIFHFSSTSCGWGESRLHIVGSREWNGTTAYNSAKSDLYCVCAQGKIWEVVCLLHPDTDRAGCLISKKTIIIRN